MEIKLETSHELTSSMKVDKDELSINSEWSNEDQELFLNENDRNPQSEEASIHIVKIDENYFNSFQLLDKLLTKKKNFSDPKSDAN